ncbi:hypothetical protein GQ53DRAFT_728714 [Thozetella sp. PMI_491]|nr:hypothetical protein GQ53DRAFT_728714 [Thozetella sp. PMI_491]
MPHEEKNAPIQCQLLKYPLQDPGEGIHLYEALSYVWGPEAEHSEHNQMPRDSQQTKGSRHSIYLDNYKFSVGENLYAALLSLRNYALERVIWIDAICINQKDNTEKGHQVNSMAKIYTRANRVIVWLGEAADNSDQALEVIRAAAEEQRACPPINKTDENAILALLSRPWFQRVWVLQEVAAARHILIKCGPAELDGYVFCLGLSSLNLSYESPNLQSLIQSVTYLIRGAIFRPKYARDERSSPGRSSLSIRPLSELVDIYHTRKATIRHDRIYALLGMSSDDPYAAGLSADYGASWKDVFQKLIQFSLFGQISDQIFGQISVNTWDDKEVAIIKGNGRVLGTISSVERNPRDDRQSVYITWNKEFSFIDAKGESSSHWTFDASASPIQKGDVICLLSKALKPTIIRPRNDYSAVIMITVPMPVPDLLEAASTTWSTLLQSITSVPHNILLVWDWTVSQDNLLDQEYVHLMGSREISTCMTQECPEKAIRLWDFGLLLDGQEKHEKAGEYIQSAAQALGTVLQRMDNLELPHLSHNTWTKSDGGWLKEMAAQDNYGWTPLGRAAISSYDAVVKQLLDKGANIEAQDKSGRTLLGRAAISGLDAVVKQLLDKGANIEAQDKSGRTPLGWAASNGHDAIVQLLKSHPTKLLL